MNEQELRHILARNPGVTIADAIADEDTSRRKVRHAEPERNEAATLDKMAKGKVKSHGSIKVCFVGCRTKLLDPDNFAGSCKDLIDGLRKYLLIPDDSAEHIILETSQCRVKTRKEERTEIVITYP